MNGGCALCHTDPNGGSPLRPFGSKLVQSYGLSSDMVNEEDMSLVNALNTMADSPDANLIADIKKGVDPNSDPGASAGALPVPEYGCTAAPSGRLPGRMSWLPAGSGNRRPALRPPVEAPARDRQLTYRSRTLVAASRLSPQNVVDSSAPPPPGTAIGPSATSRCFGAVTMSVMPVAIARPPAA